jgi:hypothetical protein
MGMVTVRTQQEELKLVEKNKAVEEYKKLDKRSKNIDDVLKRLEIIERILGVE